MSTFREAFLLARHEIDEGGDPELVVPPLLELAEAPEEIEMAQALYGDEDDDEDTV